MNLHEMIQEVQKAGYSFEDASAKVGQDIVLKGISDSSLSRFVTIKGGVVMRSITGNVRRTTQDMDIDFIKYSLSDESIESFIRKINCISTIKIARKGQITELNQQDYNGKSVRILIVDEDGTQIESKIDLGVHKRFEIEQEEYCFDIALDEKGVSLLINSKEQMFTEKLRSLLKFGVFSTRYKDIFDMYYHKNRIDKAKLAICLDSYIFSDAGMRENNMTDIVHRVEKVFNNPVYKKKVDGSDKRWLDEDIDTIFNGILQYLIEYEK